MCSTVHLPHASIAYTNREPIYTPRPPICTNSQQAPTGRVIFYWITVINKDVLVHRMAFRLFFG